MSRIRRVLSGLSHFSMCRGIVIDGAKRTQRLQTAQNFSLTSQRLCKPEKPTDEEDKDQNQPIKFSTSKASQTIWNVDRSFGSQYQRPWWKVLPISIFGVSLLLWCVLRSETDIDDQLQKNLFEHLPGFLPDEEVKGKSS